MSKSLRLGCPIFIAIFYQTTRMLQIPASHLIFQNPFSSTILVPFQCLRFITFGGIFLSSLFFRSNICAVFLILPPFQLLKHSF